MINQWEIKEKTSNLLEARENASDQDGVGFSFAFDWLRWWRENEVEQNQRNPGSLSMRN